MAQLTQLLWLLPGAEQTLVFDAGGLDFIIARQIPRIGNSQPDCRLMLGAVVVTNTVVGHEPCCFLRDTDSHLPVFVVGMARHLMNAG